MRCGLKVLAVYKNDVYAENLKGVPSTANNSCSFIEYKLEFFNDN